MKILITGAAGFIGSKLAYQLLKDGHQIVGIDNLNDYYDPNLKYNRLRHFFNIKISNSWPWGSSIPKTGNTSGYVDYPDMPWGINIVPKTDRGLFKFCRLDITDFNSLKMLFELERFEAVVNLAAQAGVRYSIENPQTYIESNIFGFTNILECCRMYSINHLIYASSSSVYGGNIKTPFEETDRVDNPVSLYAATKKSNELFANVYSHLYKMNVTGLRFFTVYGPWGRPDMAPMLFANAILNNKPINVFNNGNLSRDFTYIDDIVAGIIKVISTPIKGHNPINKIYNIGRGEPVKLMDFIKTIEDNIGKKAKMNMQPMQAGDVSITYADTKRLNEYYGYHPTTNLSDGINLFIDWYKSYYNEL